MIKDNLVILFQGDSITDGNRDRGQDLNHILGHGYVFSIASQLGSQYAEQRPTFINRGISGNRLSDLYGRWNEDAFALQPNIISILIGINDAAAVIYKDDRGYVDRYARLYKQLLLETKDVLPHVKLVLCEPFLMKTKHNEVVFEQWDELVKQYKQEVKQLAQQHDAVFVPLQDMFEQAAKRTCTEDWLWDGIHPTVAGHYLLAQRWLDVVKPILS